MTPGYIALLRFFNSMKLSSTRNWFHFHTSTKLQSSENTLTFSLHPPKIWIDILFGSFAFERTLICQLNLFRNIACSLPALGFLGRHKKIFIGQTRIKELIFWTWQPLVSCPQDDSLGEQFTKLRWNLFIKHWKSGAPLGPDIVLCVLTIYHTITQTNTVTEANTG